MKAVLLIDFGSTYTKVTAVDLDSESLIGTASAYTTVQTDINEGLENALCELEKKTGKIEFSERFACSSAAGGLRMVTSGLVPELTAEAAKRASLGAGAKVIKVYSFELTEDDAAEIGEIKPDILLLCGGTDGGNKECIINNAKTVAKIPADFPVIIAGNRAASAECKHILSGRETFVCENVMPKFGTLNIVPAQKEIRELFLRRIIEAKGLSKASELISGIMMPTPSAVLKAMTLLADGTDGEPGIGELIAIDVGGATTDVYSIASGMPTRSDTVFKGLPEPYAKRTVEGDIGMRYSLRGICEAAGMSRIAALSGLSVNRCEELAEHLSRNTDIIPQGDSELEAFDYALACAAVETAVTRHAGTMEEAYTLMGLTFVQSGKDLTEAKRIVVTGGSLIHTGRTAEIAAHALYNPANPNSLKPKTADILVDRKYILSAMGLLSEHYPKTALRIMKKELENYGNQQ